MSVFRINVFCFLLIISALWYCKPKEEKLFQGDFNEAPLSFSSDSIEFDTLLTTVGSTTRRLRVYNKTDNAIEIDNIQLGSSSSIFSLIIDGLPTNSAQKTFLRGKDSLYVLVTSKIDPRDKNLPFLISDSILFQSGSFLQKVILTAWGQDASFISDTLIPCNAVWNSPRPYVITKSIKVAKDCKFSLGKGTTLLFARNASLNIEGTLIIEGSAEEPVNIKGARIGTYYESLAGEWGGINFSKSSKNNSINYAVITSSSSGLEIESEYDSDTLPELSIKNTIIKRTKGYCLFATHSDIQLENVVLASAPERLYYHEGGGSITIAHGTFVNLKNSFARDKSSLFFSGYYLDSTNNELNQPLKVTITNSIVWGDKKDELRADRVEEATTTASVSYSLLKTTDNSYNTNGNIIYNENKQPFLDEEKEVKFENPDKNIYRPVKESIFINKGKWNQDNFTNDDLEGKDRDGNPDMGAYEWVGK